MEINERFKRPTWDEYFLEIARVASTRANCPRGSYGAVLVDNRNHILSVGYNGTASGSPNCSDTWDVDSDCGGREDAPGDYSRCRAIHAEINALVNCTDITKIDKIYTNGMPCRDCAKVIANTPIREVHFEKDKPRPDTENILRAAGKLLFAH